MVRKIRKKIAVTKWSLVRLLISLGVMTLAFSGSSERNLSARLEAAASGPELDASEMFEGTCQMPVMADSDMSAFTGSPVASSEMLGGDISPVRYVRDPYPTFNGIAVDGENGKVLMSDSNRKGLMLYDRASGSHSIAETSPQRQVMGPNTLLGFVAGVALDSERREIYGVNNDVEDNLAVFSYDDDGDLKPKRALALPHGVWGIALGQSRDELAVSVQNLHAIAIYRRGAKGVEPAVRSIRGPNTGMADPHGIAWDQNHKEIVIANHGNKSVATENKGTEVFSAPGSFSAPTTPSVVGQILRPSITVYPEAADGNVKSLRTIQGARTQLAWPMGVDVDPERNEIVVANNGDNSVLIFSRTASGDVAPVRIIRGARTGIDHPMGVAVDRKNNELWVANYGNHTAVVFDRTANGNIAPKRVVRNAPKGTPTGGFGNPMATAYDPKREEILVPN